VSRGTFSAGAQTTQNFKISTLRTIHQIIQEKTANPGLQQDASATATILSNIIQNTLCNNVPRFLENAGNFETDYWLLKTSGGGRH
jgi:hypothetical protein